MRRRNRHSRGPLRVSCLTDRIMSQEPSSAALALHDKTGRAFIVRPYQSRDLRALEDFYMTFEPKRTAQGLPPGDLESIHRWLMRTLNRGYHLLVDIEGTVLGHLMLMPIPDRPNALELANFIHQSNRDCGIGTHLNRVGARVAQDAGKSALWLSVEPSNTVAIRSYENAGFRRIPGSLWAPEIEMEIPLLENVIPV